MLNDPFLAFNFIVFLLSEIFCFKVVCYIWAEGCLQDKKRWIITNIKSLDPPFIPVYLSRICAVKTVC